MLRPLAGAGVTKGDLRLARGLLKRSTKQAPGPAKTVTQTTAQIFLVYVARHTEWRRQADKRRHMFCALDSIGGRSSSGRGIDRFRRSATPVAEVVSAFTGSELKKESGQRTSGNAERQRRATKLREAVVERARERANSPADIAAFLDVSVGHWYRLRKDPARLANLPLARLERLAKYVGWTRVQVMLAVGWLQDGELQETLPQQEAMKSALYRLERSGFSSGVATPLASATGDHQLLMARLFIAIEADAMAPTV